MRAIMLLRFFAIRLAVPALAIGLKSCRNCTEEQYNEISYFHPNIVHGFTTGADPPQKPNPRPPPPPPPGPARPRPGTVAASDELWDRSGAKGCTLGWAMQAQDQDAGNLYVPTRNTASSSYSTTADLLKWFWFPYPVERIAESFHNLNSTWGIGWALKELGISDYTTEYEGGKNHLISIAHENYANGMPPVDEQWYKADSAWFRATGASYSFTVNTEQGIIISLNRESPKWSAKDRHPLVEEVLQPKLNRFSDVAWITWKAMNAAPWSSTPNVKGLKYFMSVSITNKETQQIIKRALEANHWELNEWPGHTFERGWTEAKAIVGSPNVQGFAYFLIQHKAELRNMYLDKIQVFKGETKAELPCILIHVKQPLGQTVEIKQRDNGNGALREHVFRSRL